MNSQLAPALLDGPAVLPTEQQGGYKERLAPCAVAHLFMMITGPQKKVAALERYSWKGTLGESTHVT